MSREYSTLEEYFSLMHRRPELFSDSAEWKIVRNAEEIREYAEKAQKPVGIVYKSDYHYMTVDLVTDGTGKRFTYERVIPVSCGPSVVCVTVYNGKFLLLDQYRHAIGRRQLSFPRGFGTHGLSAEENAIKELEEEIAGRVRNLTHLGSVCADSGLTSGETEVFLVELESYNYRSCEGIEKLVFLGEEDLDAYIKAGKIDDGFTLAAYTLYKARK